LPLLAASTAFLNAGHLNWRLAIGGSGIVAAIFGVIFYLNVENTPPGKVYQRPSKSGGMEVTSARSFGGLLLVNLPLFVAMGLIAWRLSEVKFITPDIMIALWGFFVLVYAFQSYKSWQVNREVLVGEKRYEPSDRYAISQVFLLGLAYVASFGSELAVVSMLPEFFQKTFGLDPTMAGLSAASYPMINLFARPAGGVICDKVGSRKWALTMILGGIGLSYLIVSQINNTWPLPVAIGTLMFSALFVCAGAGATFGIAPLLQRRVTGQIAGIIGAYGSVGSVFYAVLYSALPSNPIGNMEFFQVLGLTSIVTSFLCAFCLREPNMKLAAGVNDAAVVLGH
jgi:MFS transporter, NNP family, nitrate/nitrite transporter